jgi:ubiquinone/menaquinone biosynthesis C-methylase UbiE
VVNLFSCHGSLTPVRERIFTILRMKRRPTRELLDDDQGTPAEIAGSLRDLRWFNRWFGGTSTTRALFKGTASDSARNSFTVLEVGSGDGFLIRTVASELSPGLKLDVTLLDRAASHLPVNGSMRKVAGDALRLPFRDSSFDLVSSSLFLHHLSPQQAVAFAREALRVSRTAVLVHDLIRDPIHFVFAFAGRPLYRSRITRHDAPASVRQAYTTFEVADFFRDAGAADIRVKQRFFYRMGVVARKTS